MSPPDFDEHHFHLGKCLDKLLHGENVHGGVFADGGVRAGSGLHRQNAGRIDEAGAADALGVLARDEIVGDDRHLDVARLEGGDQSFHQGRLAGAHRSADADARNAGHFRLLIHRSMYL